MWATSPTAQTTTWPLQKQDSSQALAFRHPAASTGPPHLEPPMPPHTNPQPPPVSRLRSPSSPSYSPMRPPLLHPPALGVPPLSPSEPGSIPAPAAAVEPPSVPSAPFTVEQPPEITAFASPQISSSPEKALDSSAPNRFNDLAFENPGARTRAGGFSTASTALDNRAGQVTLLDSLGVINASVTLCPGPAEWRNLTLGRRPTWR